MNSAQLSEDIVKDIGNAIRLHGIYQLTDKGAHEVMEIDDWANKILSLSPPSAVHCLKLVLSKHEYGEEFVRSFLCHVDGHDDEQVGHFYDDETLSNHY